MFDPDEIPVLDESFFEDTSQPEHHDFRLADFEPPLGHEWLGISFERMDDKVAVRLRGQRLITGEFTICEAVVPIHQSGDKDLFVYMVDRARTLWPDAKSG